MKLQDIDKSALPYRPCVGIMLANRDGKVFVGKRLVDLGVFFRYAEGLASVQGLA